jgi:hypothetical protein
MHVDTPRHLLLGKTSTAPHEQGGRVLQVQLYKATDDASLLQHTNSPKLSVKGQQMRTMRTR